MYGGEVAHPWPVGRSRTSSTRDAWAQANSKWGQLHAFVRLRHAQGHEVQLYEGTFLVGRMDQHRYTAGTTVLYYPGPPVSARVVHSPPWC